MTLVYTRDQLLADDAYARPQIEGGLRLHGGFDAAGRYISPRTKHRWPAVRAWQAQLATRGFPLVDASVRLLKRGNYPSVAQERLLLRAGLGEFLWNGLTITGVVEARGKVLCDATAPHFQDIVVEDLAGTCTGHLNTGLLYAHGLDEGGGQGQDGQTLGGHDAMWFAVRDALFGADAYPIPEVPDTLSRPQTGRLMPQVPKVYEDWILLLMNVLMIEVRAESFFAFCTAVMRSPDVFADRRAAAEHAAKLVERIREDEQIHVAYLQTFVSELRSLTFKTADGGRIAGAAVIDPVWAGMIAWHAETNADFQQAQARAAIEARLASHPQGRALLAEFHALETKAAA